MGLCHCCCHCCCAATRVLEQEAAARRAAAARAKAAEEEAARQAAAAARAEEKKRIRAAQTRYVHDVVLASVFTWCSQAQLRSVNPRILCNQCLCSKTHCRSYSQSMTLLSPCITLSLHHRISVTLNGALTAQVPPPGTWVDRSTGQAAGSIQEAMESSTVSASSGTSSRSGTPNLPILARMRVQIAGSCSKAQLQPPASTGSDTSSVTSIAIGGTRPAPVSLQVSDIRQSQVTRLYESADVAVEETASLAGKRGCD
jgi:hypothetical protein